MATFKSKAFIGRNFYRAMSEEPAQISATIKVPAGTAIAAADVFKFFKIGANQRILEATLSVDDIDTGATATISLGYDALTQSDVPAAFISVSNIGQAGGTVRVENGGTPAFASGLVSPLTESMVVQAVIGTGPAGNPNTDRYLTCTVKLAAVSGTPAITPEYVYRNRYNTLGVGSI